MDASIETPDAGVKFRRVMLHIYLEDISIEEVLGFMNAVTDVVNEE